MKQGAPLAILALERRLFFSAPAPRAAGMLPGGRLQQLYARQAQRQEAAERAAEAAARASFAEHRWRLAYHRWAAARRTAAAAPVPVPDGALDRIADFLATPFAPPGQEAAVAASLFARIRR